ncbi:MAG: radical SAM protein [Candidatus Hydrogenedentes bacterium]|jgi:anaerobic magnesium-protoporphyrin IX monomethyl ester cyclase|nr:radical SAM protein [Candidatus Hydrogenedentota bacterium]
MKLFFLNPPHVLPIMRRYMCSYYSPEYMLPPTDLLSLATFVRENNKAEVKVFDAIAEGYDLKGVLQKIADYAPDMIVVLMGVKVFGDDLDTIALIKEHFPETTLTIFGYYPTAFTSNLLEKIKVDLILRSEPEFPLSQYIDRMETGGAIDGIAGLAGRTADGLLFDNKEQRIEDADALPFPDPSLVTMKRYEEAFLGGPCGAILSIRGCPFSCSYCTTTYGRYVTMRSPESVVKEMKYLKEKGIKTIRFLDDIFTCDKGRVISICKGIIESNLNIPWTCLSRIDTLDKEMLDWMCKAGCRRVMIGIESYSARVLDRLHKGISPEMINPKLELIHKSGMKILAFFMVGAPFETEEDLEETIRGALDSPLDFIIVTSIEPFAATPYFHQLSDQIAFNLVPFKCEYKDPDVYRIANARRQRLYRRFYLRPRILFIHLLTFINNPWRTLKLLRAFLFPTKT